MIKGLGVLGVNGQANQDDSRTEKLEDKDKYVLVVPRIYWLGSV